MEVLLRAEKGTSTKPMVEYAEEKLSKLDKYIENAENVTANILVKYRPNGTKVEATIPIKSLILRAEEVQPDYYAAVDVVLDKLERQIKKNKYKIKNHNTKIEDTFAFEAIDLDDLEAYENEPQIVKRKKIESKPMSEDEALLQMELLGHEFFLYKDAETNRACVVYKRNDGNYGLIESD